MVQRTFYPWRGPDPQTQCDSVTAADPPQRKRLLEIRHGYTLHDLEMMTRAATVADRSMAMPLRERHDIAWSAIAEALCAAEEPPHRQELIRAGWQAIYRAVREEYRQHGYAGREWGDGPGSAPRFAEYWYAPVAGSCEDWVVDKVATRQILATLTDAGREAITALAVYGDYVLAARSLGLTRDAFQARMNKARATARGWWFEGETPRKPVLDRRRAPRGGSDRCPSGHPWTAENTRFNERVVNGVLRRHRRCRTCERDRNARRPRRAAA